MYPNNLRFPFQQCRRRGAGGRLFLPLRLQRLEYLLRLTDGTLERYQVTYTASIEAEKSQQRWHYRGHVSRQIAVYNRAGLRFDQADVDRRVELSPDVCRDAIPGRYSWREYAFEREPSLPEDEFEEVYEWFTSAFAISVVADKRHVESQFRQMYKGVEAISEIE